MGAVGLIATVSEHAPDESRLAGIRGDLGGRRDGGIADHSEGIVAGHGRAASVLEAHRNRMSGARGEVGSRWQIVFHRRGIADFGNRARSDGHAIKGEAQAVRLDGAAGGFGDVESKSSRVAHDTQNRAGRDCGTRDFIGRSA